MCTLTVIPHSEGAGFRLVTNRDEQRDRAPAGPPKVVHVEGVNACWPVDPVGGGTWIAVAETGLTLGLLNVNDGPAVVASAGETATSRGLVIPRLIGAESADAAMRALRGTRLATYRPFRLVAADRSGVWSARWAGSRLDVRTHQRRPICFVSSGLGDDVVAPRLALFDEWVSAGRFAGDGQDQFHRHRWPDRPEASVDMCRADARTVSRTAVEIHGDPARRPELVYDAIDEEPVRVIVPAHRADSRGVKGREPTRC